MGLLEDLNPESMQVLEQQVKSDLAWGEKMRMQVRSITRREAISDIMGKLEGSDSEDDEELAEEAMKEIEEEDVAAEQRWISEHEKVHRRRKQLRERDERMHESQQALEKYEERRRAIVVDVSTSIRPPWLEGPTDSRRHFSSQLPIGMKQTAGVGVAWSQPAATTGARLATTSAPAHVAAAPAAPSLFAPSWTVAAPAAAAPAAPAPGGPRRARRAC